MNEELLAQLEIEFEKWKQIFNIDDTLKRDDLTPKQKADKIAPSMAYLTQNGELYYEYFGFFMEKEYKVLSYAIATYGEKRIKEANQLSQNPEGPNVGGR